MLKRGLGYYIVQVILPSIIAMSCSICGYWVKLQIGAARAWVAMCALLTVLTQQTSASRVVPKVSYIKVRLYLPAARGL